MIVVALTRLTLVVDVTAGFALSQFNFGPGNEHLGNAVELVSAWRTFTCRMHKDATTLVQIQCYTPYGHTTFFPLPLPRHILLPLFCFVRLLEVLDTIDVIASL